MKILLIETALILGWLIFLKITNWPRVEKIYVTPKDSIRYKDYPYNCIESRRQNFWSLQRIYFIRSTRDFWFDGILSHSWWGNFESNNLSTIKALLANYLKVDLPEAISGWGEVRLTVWNDIVLLVTEAEEMPEVKFVLTFPAKGLKDGRFLSHTCSCFVQHWLGESASRIENDHYVFSA